MGLDSVELVLAIEEEFGLDIPEQDAYQMFTVSDIFDWLKIRVATVDPIACLSQRIFYKLRRALIENYGLKRNLIGPDSRLTDFVPLKYVEEGWPFLQMFIDLETPPFKVANEFLGFKLSGDTLTMRELVDSLIVVNGRRMAPQRDSESEIWRRLVAVIVRQTDVLPEQVVPDASLTRDLGID